MAISQSVKTAIHLCLLITVWLFSVPLPAEVIENYRAKLFKLDGSNSYQIYSQSSVTIREGDSSLLHNVYYYGPGPEQIAAEEKVYYVKGQLKDYLIIHHQLEEDWRTLIEKDRVVFKKRDWKDNSFEEGSEELTDNFVVAPMVIPYLQKNWEKVLKGEEVHVRFGVPARRETVGFKVFLDGEGEVDGKPAVILKMKPSSFFIALLVDPLFMYMTKDGKALLRLKGRTLPRKRVGEHYKDTDVDTYFQNLSVDFGG